MYLDAESNDRIAQGKVLGFLHLSKNPCPFNVIYAAEKLQLTPEQISAALRALEAEGVVEVVMSRAIVTLKDVPSTPDPKSEPTEVPRVLVTDFAPGDRVSFFAPWTDVNTQVIGTVSGEDCFVANSLIVEFVHPETDQPITQTIEVKHLTKLPPESKKKGVRK
jgi:hypothetical protein